MRTVSDPDNREAGLRALAELGVVAQHEGIVEGPDAASKTQAKQRRIAVEEQHRVADAGARGLGELHGIYMTMAIKSLKLASAATTSKSFSDASSNFTRSHISLRSGRQLRATVRHLAGRL